MPSPRTAAIVAVTALTIALAACSSPSGPGTSLVAAQPTGPSNNSTFSFYSQPVTLTVKTGVATGGATPATTIEVATDTAFATIVTIEALELDDATEAQLDVEGLLAFSEHLLTNVSTVWIELDLDQKQRVYQVLFPEGLRFD